jgi:hypothetical protein
VYENRVVRRIVEPKRDEMGEVGEDCIMRSFINFKLQQILLGDQIKEDEMGGACSTYGRDEKCLQCFGFKT